MKRSSQFDDLAYIESRAERRVLGRYYKQILENIGPVGPEFFFGGPGLMFELTARSSLIDFIRIS